MIMGATTCTSETWERQAASMGGDSSGSMECPGGDKASSRYSTDAQSTGNGSEPGIAGSAANTTQPTWSAQGARSLQGLSGSAKWSGMSPVARVPPFATIAIDSRVTLCVVSPVSNANVRTATATRLSMAMQK